MDKPISGKPFVLTALALAVLLGDSAGARAGQVPEKGPGDQPAAPAPSPPAPPSPPSAPMPAPAVAPPVAPTVQAQPSMPPPPPPLPEVAPIQPAILAPAGDEEAASWFARAPLTVSVGEGAQRWSATLYGFVEADYIFDTTRSYDDSIGGSLVARSDTYDGTVGRSQFSIRNTRLGLKFDAPVVAGMKPTAVIETDFFGSDPHPPSASESSFFASPGLRLRQAYLKLQNDYVDVLAGQTYDLFGWQGYFFPASIEFLGLPNQLFSRNAQLRLSHNFNASGDVSVELAAAAVRPAQRDSAVPDFSGGLRVGINKWKGLTTPGNVGTVARPASIGVSGIMRQFKVNAFDPPPTQSSNSVTGWGVSVDALIPVIPAVNANDRSNRLTLTGSFVVGSGIADLINAGGGASFPTLPNPGQANPPPVYTPDVDNGLVSFDTQGVLHSIDWRAFKAGLQYYFPTGRVMLSVNYTQAYSANMSSLFPKGGAEIELLSRVANMSQYGDVNLFFDATPAVRFGVSGQYTRVEYLDGLQPHNIRAMGQALYAF